MAAKHLSCYSLLGLRRDANAAAVRQAYRKCALLRHPDKPGGSIEAFRALALAFEMLSDDRLRRRYDEQLARTNSQDGVVPNETPHADPPPATAVIGIDRSRCRQRKVRVASGSATDASVGAAATAAPVGPSQSTRGASDALLDNLLAALEDQWENLLMGASYNTLQDALRTVRETLLRLNMRRILKRHCLTAAPHAFKQHERAASAAFKSSGRSAQHMRGICRVQGPRVRSHRWYAMIGVGSLIIRSQHTADLNEAISFHIMLTQAKAAILAEQDSAASPTFDESARVALKSMDADCCGAGIRRIKPSFFVNVRPTKTPTVRDIEEALRMRREVLDARHEGAEACNRVATQQRLRLAEQLRTNRARAAKERESRQKAEAERRLTRKEAQQEHLRKQSRFLRLRTLLRKAMTAAGIRERKERLREKKGSTSSAPKKTLASVLSKAGLTHLPKEVRAVVDEHDSFSFSAYVRVPDSAAMEGPPRSSVLDAVSDSEQLAYVLASHGFREAQECLVDLELAAFQVLAAKNGIQMPWE